MKTGAHRENGFTLIEFIVSLVLVAIMASMLYAYFGSAFTQSSVPIIRLQQASELHRVTENIVADYNRLNKINLRRVWRSDDAPYSAGDIVVPAGNDGHYYECKASCNAEPPGAEWNEAGLVWNADTTYESGDIVIPYYNNGHFYRAGNAGTSGADEPDWPVIDGSDVDDNGITWTNAGTVLHNSEGSIDSLLNTGEPPYTLARMDEYGDGFEVAELKFIQFDDDDNEVDAGTDGTSSEKSILKITLRSTHTGETLTQLFTIE